MSEVLDSSDPPDDDLDFDPDTGDGFDDDEVGEPGTVGRWVAGIATPAALAVAAVIVATASLLDLPVIGSAASSLSLAHTFAPSTFFERAESLGQLIVAVVGAVLALTARRGRASDGERPAPAEWVGTVSAAALLVATVSAVLAIASLVISATARAPGIGTSINQQIVSQGSGRD
jgi:hypothetical protein